MTNVYCQTITAWHCTACKNTEKKLQKSPKLSQAYLKVLQTYQEARQVWYLPHFPVLRPDKTNTKTHIVFESTTKPHIVFHASTKFKGVSLNYIVLQGPKLQNDLFAVVLRLRREPVAVMRDIKKMYLQIKLQPEDQPYHRFL